jgi:hypothetical protein
VIRRGSQKFRAGVLAAILAATLQFVFLAGSLSGAFSAQAGPGDAVSGQCSDTPGQGGHDDTACLLCPVCLSVTLPGSLPPPSPGVPLPAMRAAEAHVAATAPQLGATRILGAAFPRGPPPAI